MSLRLIFNLITISGIFSKSGDLDILPPPPPFPEIGTEYKEAKEVQKVRKQKEKELELQRRREEKEKLAEKRRKEKLSEENKKRKKKKVFDFFHSKGLVKTEQEKKVLVKQKREYIKSREMAKRKEFERIRKLEEEKAREIERIRRQGEKELELQKKKQEKERKEIEKRQQKELKLKKVKEHEVIHKEEEKPKNTFFGKIFGKKKDEYDLAKELEEIEKITPKPVKEEKAKLEIPELISLKAEKFGKKTAKPEEVIKEEDEIQKAISGMKGKVPSIIKGLFKKKEVVEDKIGTPEVMPRTYDKIDYMGEIEEKMHKARLALMDFKFDRAKRVYIEIMKMYNEIEPKKKAKVYQDIKDLYYERKSAEKFGK